MNAMIGWLGRQAPDVIATVRRFPLAILLLALGTVVALALANEWYRDDEDTAGWLAVGLLTGAIYAVAGQLYREGRPRPLWLAGLLTWGLPLAVVAGLAGLQIRNTEWLVTPMLPAIGVFWMSVAGLTGIGRGQGRGRQQNRFWWLNHRAVTTGAVALVGFAIIGLGLMAVERSVSILFGLELDSLVYKFILPIVALFLTPVYWLATVPRLDDYEAEALDEPDFLSRAIGFLGEFVLTPLLIIYALILVAYAVQIVITGTLPNGVLGWVVPVFLVTGAANWLVLHPPFMRRHRFVRLFRRAWFWLTIVPLLLYAVAVWVRVDAYGLTSERVLLIAGGLWATLLTLVYLTRKFADIRFIPALAGLVLVLLSVGPWNMLNVSRWHQAQRLDGAMIVSGAIEGVTPDWTEDTAAAARGAIRYLLNDDEGRERLTALMTERGYSLDTENRLGAGSIFEMLALPDVVPGRHGDIVHLNRYPDLGPIDISGTPLIVPQVTIYETDLTSEAAGLGFRLSGTSLIVSRDDERVQEVPLDDWLDRQGEQLTDPLIDFEVEGRTYRLVVTAVNYRVRTEPDDEARAIVYLDAFLAYADTE